MTIQFFTLYDLLNSHQTLPLGKEFSKSGIVASGKTL